MSTDAIEQSGYLLPSSNGQIFPRNIKLIIVANFTKIPAEYILIITLETLFLSILGKISYII